jgi:hypothetical protein
MQSAQEILSLGLSSSCSTLMSEDIADWKQNSVMWALQRSGGS